MWLTSSDANVDGGSDDTIKALHSGYNAVYFSNNICCITRLPATASAPTSFGNDEIRFSK